MQQVNLHKQRLITILIGIIGLIFLFLPWRKIPGVKTYMGFGIWGGIICAVAIVALIAVCILVGDKTKPLDKQAKMIAIACLAIMLLMTIIVLIAGGGNQRVSYGYQIVEIKASIGIGVWLSLILDLIGIVWVTGFLDQLMQQAKSTTAVSTNPPSPPPPKA